MYFSYDFIDNIFFTSLPYCKNAVYNTYYVQNVLTIYAVGKASSQG